VVTTTARLAVVAFLQGELRAQPATRLRRDRLRAATCRYLCRRRDDVRLRQRLKELAQKRPRFGYRRLWWTLRKREHFRVNHKRVHRIYREEGLQVRRRRRKRVSMVRQPMVPPTQPNERWSIDFMRDTLGDAKAFRTFNLVDDLTRECPAIEVAKSIPGARVVRVLERSAVNRGYAKRVVADNGPELTGQALDEWAYRNGVELHFITPGRPMENAYIESFMPGAQRSTINGRRTIRACNASTMLAVAGPRGGGLPQRMRATRSRALAAHGEGAGARVGVVPAYREAQARQHRSPDAGVPRLRPRGGGAGPGVRRDRRGLLDAVLRGRGASVIQ
jgi:putative transposase